MNARQKSFCSPLSRLSLIGLPLIGLAALSTPLAVAEPITIQPTAPSVTSTINTPISNDEIVVPLDPKDYPQGLLFPYSLIDSALAGNTDLNGNVLYPNLKDNKRLNLYVQAAAHADLSQFPAFDVYVVDPETGRKSKVTKNREPELVFWINTYNALFLSALAQAYPVKSVTEIKDFDTSKTHTVAGKKYSFKELRAKIIDFGDPRAVFALTTGTAGGFLPSPTAIRYVELSSRLDSAIAVFINDPRNVKLNRIQNVVMVNGALKEIDPYFNKTGRRYKWGGIRALLSGYTDQRTNRSYFTTNEYRIEFDKNDLSINDRMNGSQVTMVSPSN